MEKAKKPKYNLWQNTAYFLKLAWKIHKWTIFMCVLVAVVSVTLSTLELIIVPKVLEKIETSVPLNELIKTIIVLSGSLMLVKGFDAYLDASSQSGRTFVRVELTGKIGDKFSNTSYPNLFDTSFIEMATRAVFTVNSNDKAGEHIWITYSEFLTNLFGLIVYLYLLKEIELWIISLVIITSIISYLFNRRFNEWSYRNKDVMNQYFLQIEYIDSISTSRDKAKDIRIFRMQPWLESVFNKFMNLIHGYLIKREKMFFLTHVIDLLLTLLRNGIAYFYLFNLVFNDGISVSEFLLYFSVVSGFSRWVVGILNKLQELNKESVEISILREFLEWEEPFKFEEGKPFIKEDKAYEIKLENVSFCYPESNKNILTNINLTIKPGEKVAIVGLNGAGKTTLIKLICGFLDPTEGKVLIDGKDICEYNHNDIYKLFSAVFQEFSVLEATVAENVAQRVNNIDEIKVWNCLEKAALIEKIKSFPEGIKTHIGRQVYEDGMELSGGQIQRLMLARALYKDGSILVLDEPTAALDSIAENDIYMKYSEMTEGKTSIFISHRLASTRFCDRILFLENGKITEEGTHDELIAMNKGYANLFEVQSRYYKEDKKYE